MLPNHSPLVIAEQFGTLDHALSGANGLGLGRAPGSDQRTMMALRSPYERRSDNFPRDVAELVDWFDARDPKSRCAPGTRLWRKNPRVVVRLQPLQRATGGAAWSAVCVCLTLARRIVVPGTTSIAATSNRRLDWKNHTRWCASILSPPIATATLTFCLPQCSKPL